MGLYDSRIYVVVSDKSSWKLEKIRKTCKWISKHIWREKKWTKMWTSFWAKITKGVLLYSPIKPSPKPKITIILSIWSSIDFKSHSPLYLTGGFTLEVLKRKWFQSEVLTLIKDAVFCPGMASPTLQDILQGTCWCLLYSRIETSV